MNTILSIVRDDHLRILKLFDQLLRTYRTKPKLWRESWDALRRLVSLHSLIEEETLYPLLKEKISEDFVAISLVQHRMSDRCISDLESMPLASAKWFATLSRFRELLLDHMALEERELRRVLGNNMTKEEIQLLSLKLKHARAA